MARTRGSESRTTADQPTKGGEAVKGGDAATVDPRAGTEVDATTLVDRPDDAGGLGRQADGAALPTQEELEPTAGVRADGPVGDASLAGPAQREVHDPGGVVGDGPQAGLSAEMDGLDDLLAGQGGYGGADGRNDASDSGGPGDPNAPDPDFGAGSPVGGAGWHGLDGAAGKLGDWQQQYVNKLNEQMKDAQADGDYERAEQIADRVHQFVAEQRGEAPASAEGAGDGAGQGGDTPYEMATSFGSGAPGATKQVWNKETGEMEEVPADTPTGSVPAVTQKVQMQQTGTDAQGNQETATPPDAGGAAEDREWEGDAPDLHGDFIEAYHQQQTGADLGGDVDPDPNADPVTGVMDGDAADADPYVAEYEPGVEITEDQVDAAAGRIDPVPDEEFLEA